MKRRIKEAISHPLISGSIIIFAGTLLGNFLNFLFNFFMSRNLSVSDYGILASLNSLILVFALIADSFVPTIVHFAAIHFAKKEHKQIGGIFFQANKIAILLGVSSFLIFAIFAKDIGIFLNIDNNFLIILVGIIVFFGYMGSLSKAILQAKLLFKYISFINVFSASTKLLFGVILVFLGYRVTGAITSYLIYFFIFYILVLFPLRNFFKRGNNVFSVGIKRIISYGGPASLALISLTFFITSDILLVKHFFSAKEAGIYAGLSLVARVIYFFSAPIASVMFPIVVQKHSREENFTNTFKISFLLVFLLSIFVTAFYFIFPDFSIRLFLKKEEYVVGAPLLGYFGIFITLYSLLSLLTNFYLSIKKTQVSILITFFAILQIILIWFNHNIFSQVLMISLFTTSLPLILLLLYYIWHYERKTKK